MAVNIYFFSGYPVFGLGEEMDRNSQNLSKTVVEDIPQKVPATTLVGSPYPHPNRFSPSLPPQNILDQISSSYSGGRQ
jgi:hypothetical protein